MWYIRGAECILPGVDSLQYLPTVGDMYTKDVEVNGAPRHIEIDDTAGQVAFRVSMNFCYKGFIMVILTLFIFCRKLMPISEVRN